MGKNKLEIDLLMKEVFKNFLLYILVAYFALSIFKGILLPVSPIYMVATLGVFSISLLIASPLLNFLTVKENFLTRFLTSSLLSVGVLYLLKLFMIDFYVEFYTFKGLNLGSLVVNSFDMVPVVTIVGCAMVIGLVSSLFFVLEKSK